jgi:MoaA/NifB/PqqE/SkfB family radical SAM enzyme
MLGQQHVNQSTPMLPGSRPAAPLDFLWLEVTAKCNLRCVHCYSDSTPQRPLHDSMTADDWNDMLEQAALLGCRAVQFIGGEPTMYPALGMLIERARELGFITVEVFTNGTIFKPKLKEVFLRHKVDLAFSVYASNSRTHDTVTKQVGSFDRTIASCSLCT